MTSILRIFIVLAVALSNFTSASNEPPQQGQQRTLANTGVSYNFYLNDMGDDNVTSSLEGESTPAITVTPSSSPSGTNTEASSKSPSSTQSPMPSYTPSMRPSTGPSLSIRPSGTPSRVPSLQPSSYPTLSPSEIPTISFSPTNSSAPSESPSGHPSTTPSAHPTTSVSPSLMPSPAPSQRPSGTPSQYPSLIPTTTPSVHPSQIPSSSPTNQPSESPSTQPSSHPTFTCHDMASYRSPINGMTCEDHQDLVCTDQPLNTSSLGELVDNCPEACKIPCGKFTQFSISVSYTLSGMPGWVDDRSKRILEKSTLDYLLPYCLERLPEQVIFRLDKVELASQDLVQSDSTRRHLLRQRKLARVEVRVECEGFTIGITTDEVSGLLVAGIDSDGYTEALQDSHEFFEDATVSSATEDSVDDDNTREESERKGASKATIVVFAVFSVSLVCFVSFACVHREQYGKWIPKMHIGERDHGDQNPSMRPWRQHRRPWFGSAWFQSPQTSPRNVESVLSIGGSSTHDGTAASATAGLLRLIASLSLSRSKSSTEREDDFEFAEPETTGVTQHEDDQAEEQDVPPILSPMSEATNDNSTATVEHPLANIIPPMIVIDNIDDSEGNSGRRRNPPSKKSQAKNPQVPSRRIEASSDFKYALRDQQSALLLPGELNIGTWSHTDDENGLASPLGIVVDSDSDMDDDISIASTPVHSKTNMEDFPPRRSMSSSALGSLDRADHDGKIIFAEKPVSALSTPTTPYKETDLSPTVNDGSEASVGPAPSLPPIDAICRNTSACTPDVVASPNYSLTPDNDVEDCTSQSLGSNTNSRWSLSPMAKAIKEASSSTPRSLKKLSSFPRIIDFSVLKKKPHSEPTGHHDDLTYGRGIPPMPNHGGDTAGAPTRYKFEAPRKGQLGLVIEANPKTGPVVHAVKDYSPLFGSVERGDHIVEIDGKKTTHSTITEITRLLAVKTGILGGSYAGNIRIVVVRPPKGPQFASRREHHNRSSSHGSASLASSRGFFDETYGIESAEMDAQHDDLLRGTMHFNDTSSDSAGYQSKFMGSF